ncbi:hypothetical protein SUDANB178_06480 [Streptomyces sp. enrichment culture]
MTCRSLDENDRISAGSCPWQTGSQAQPPSPSCPRSVCRPFPTRVPTVTGPRRCASSCPGAHATPSRPTDETSIREALLTSAAPFGAGSRIATYSTWRVIGKTSHYAKQREIAGQRRLSGSLGDRLGRRSVKRVSRHLPLVTLKDPIAHVLHRYPSQGRLPLCHLHGLGVGEPWPDQEGVARSGHLTVVTADGLPVARRHREGRPASRATRRSCAADTTTATRQSRRAGGRPEPLLPPTAVPSTTAAVPRLERTASKRTCLRHRFFWRLSAVHVVLSLRCESLRA